MLKALELVGFKSFAEKTRFEFPPGITVVVGPNGSGKSNVVDAIKWVLGEQSVKSLRGKEMADVIFNGSGSRRAINSAEVTLTFDNAQRQLAVDTDEVHITRRVYRSGEGEYLINRQACRLRDIRDLFAGTGAATEAYSVIEQGKVDVMLQASPRDRRVIFEEAAGISRFKSKKLEALRRLERVDQNLLRLSDIVEEVEGRLRSVRLQAAKARRYKEHSDRLQELRTQVGLTDWRKLGKKLAAHEEKLAELQNQVDACAAQVEAKEAEALDAETELARTDDAIRRCEQQLAAKREQIATIESTIRHQRTRSGDLEQEIARHRRQVAALNTRAGDLQEQIRESEQRLDAARHEYAALRSELDAEQQAIEQLSEQLERLRCESDTAQQEQMEQLRRAADLQSRISALNSQLEATERTRKQRSEQIEELSRSRERVSEALDEARRRQVVLARETHQFETRLRDAREALSQLRRSLDARQKEQSQLSGRRTGAAERAAVLEELEKRQEGLSGSVKQILLEARAASSGPLRHVRGLVADLLQVNVEAAPLIDVALGPLSQHLVLDGDDGALEYVQSKAQSLDGRVGLFRLDYQPPSHPADRINLQGRNGVVGPATELVETQPQFAPLVRRLLGRTWVVESLAEALALAEDAGRGLDLVTLAGELVAADGSVVLGSRQSSTGLISRRSELRALRATIEELDSKLETAATEIEQLERQIAEQDQAVANLAEEHQAASDRLAEQRLETGGCEQRLAEFDKQLEALRAELRTAEVQHQGAGEQLQQATDEKGEVEVALSSLQARANELGREFEQLERQRAERSREATAKQVRLAKSEQQVDALQQQRVQLDRDQQEREDALAESRRQLELCQQRDAEARRLILRESGAVAELYLGKEELARRAVAAHQQREALRTRRGELARQVQQTRSEIHSLEEQIHSRQLSAEGLRHERQTLAARLREDYGIELAELEHELELTEAEQHEREAVEQEIAELRRKLANIGNVNLDALAELEDLEARFASLSAQHDDLSKAKASLEQIIGKINADSRRLFAETLETVRGYFQGLFRKLFGGGHADIVLEEGEDILECGIEIVGRPPGKEPRSISLLSGGEKTLTCVALLMAIFRSRPSPFCVLDEVDAALDEANIERFIKVLKEFLAWTQFIVVTHSKKTMTCAGTLYGVTMQESGISKRVSVRFEDVSEDGHIHEAALQREEEPSEASETDATDADESQAA